MGINTKTKGRYAPPVFAIGWLISVIFLFAHAGAALAHHDFSHMPGILTEDNPAEIRNGDYLLSNNAWGKGFMAGWNQNIGLISNKNGVLSALWNWDWLSSGDGVKAYAEVIAGQKPGSRTSTLTLLPKKVNEIKAALVSYDIVSLHNGSGNTSFDLWLTDTKYPTTFAVPPITHEIMIWLETYGEMQPAGSLFEHALIGGVHYNIFVEEKMGLGWKYIALQRASSVLGIGRIDFVPIFSYLRSKGLITGGEYLASIEFGNEIVGGFGSTHLNSYSISVQ